jgi:hypothetical protein
MATYRNFTIDPSSGLLGCYDYTPVDYDGPEDKRNGTANSIEEAKRSIDVYYAERIHYRVKNERSITKFVFLIDAMNFLQKFGGILQPYLDGEVMEFDSI